MKIMYKTFISIISVLFLFLVVISSVSASGYRTTSNPDNFEIENITGYNTATFAFATVFR